MEGFRKLNPGGEAAYRCVSRILSSGNMAEDDQKTIIGNLSCSTNDTSLKQAAFEKFVVDKFSRGFGLVSNFEDEKKSLEEAIEAMNGIDLDGRDRDRNRDHGCGRRGSGGTVSSLPILLGNAPRVADMVEGMTNMKIDDDITPPVLAPKKEEPVENTSPLKATTLGAGCGIPSSFKSKRINNAEESKTSNGAPLKKKVKSENEGISVKDESGSASKIIAPPKGASPSMSTPSSEPITEDEIRAVLSRRAPVTTLNLVFKFRSRLKSNEAKKSFADVLRRIATIRKTNGANFVVLRKK